MPEPTKIGSGTNKSVSEKRLHPKSGDEKDEENDDQHVDFGDALFADKSTENIKKRVQTWGCGDGSGFTKFTARKFDPMR